MCDSHGQHKKSRGKDGRFTAVKRTLSQSGDDAMLQSKNKKKRKELMQTLFEKYVKLFFLKGGEDDFVPFSSSSGPFVETYEKLVKSSYLLGRRNRSDLLQDICKGERKKGTRSKIARRMLRNEESSNKVSRPKLYLFRRLPCMNNYTLEILPLKAWLKKLDEEKILLCSFDEAYEICCTAIGSYQKINGRNVYVGFPATRPSGSSSPDGEENCSSQENHPPNSSERCTSAQVTGNSVGCENILGLTNVGDTSASMTGTPFLQSPNAVMASPMGPSDSPSHPFLSQMNEFHDFACDDTSYRILSMLFDEKLETKFHFVAGSFLEKNRKRDLNIPVIFKCVLLHCHAKAFGTKDHAAHDRRERSLLSLKANVERLRGVLGLPSYDEICWSETTSWSSLART